MQISFDTALTSTDELTALIALCASLGGRITPPLIAVEGGLPDSTRSLREMLLGGRDGQPENTVASLVVDDVPPPPAAESTEGNDTTSNAPTAPEPAGSTQTPISDGAAVELDADGIPWDERIHASTKTKTQAGVWTKKRKVDEVLYGQIHAELQELHAGNDDTPPPPVTQETSSTPVENAPTDDTDVPPPPAPDASAEFNEFADLVNKVAPFGLPYVKLAELAVKVTDGLVTKFPDLRDKPDYWADFYKLVKNEASA